MKKRSNKLERDLVATAEEFQRRRPWRDFGNGALFLIRVPAEDDPLVASILGAGGGEFGLGLARGPAAFAGMCDLMRGAAGSHEWAESGDQLSLTFDPWEILPDELRKLVLRAGGQPRREKLVPVAFASRPFETTVSAGRSDLRLLLWILRGILVALDAGDFRPFDLDEDGRRVFELELSGSPKRPTYQARVVAWPDCPLEAPALWMLPSELDRLPRLNERWLMAHLVGSALIAGDDRLTSTFLVAAEDGQMRAVKVGLGDDLEPGKDALLHAMRGETAGDAGLPRAVLFNHQRLFDSLAPALGGLGIETALDPDSPLFQELFEFFASKLKTALEPTSPGDLKAWRELGPIVTDNLMREVDERNGRTDRALKRYFGSLEIAAKVLHELDRLGPEPAFFEWLIADYRATKRSKTLLEKLLAEEELPRDARLLLEARSHARLSIFRVDSSVPGETLAVEDVFTGERMVWHDSLLSGSGLEGWFIPMRVLSVHDWRFPIFAGPPLSSLRMEQTLAMLDAEGVDLIQGDLRDHADFLGRLWKLQLEGPQVQLLNTDGDELEHLDASFHVEDPNGLIKVFEDHEHMDFYEVDGVWIWSRPGGPGGFGEVTNLAAMTLLGSELLVEVNSHARFESVRKWLDKLPGVEFKSLAPAATDPGELPLDDQLPGPPPEPLPQEMLDELQQLLLEQHLHWIDLPSPVLSGLTPRRACQSFEGRRKVELLVRTMPPLMTPNGPLAPPRDKILAALGIAPD